MIDKTEFIKDLRQMKRNCFRNSNYDPSDDIVYLVIKHNLNWRVLWKQIVEILGE